MSRIEPGRMTHSYDGELVVFLIGMTINKPWRPDQWVPVAASMPGMLRELSNDAGSGMLGYRLTLEGANPTVVQYWDSVEKLHDYASHADGKHRPAWAAFNRLARAHPGAVGVWHETYLCSGSESIYVGTRPLGLAKATKRVPVTRNSARERMAPR